MRIRVLLKVLIGSIKVYSWTSLVYTHQKTLLKLDLFVTTSMIDSGLSIETNLQQSILGLLKMSKPRLVNYITDGVGFLIYLYSSISR